MLNEFRSTHITWDKATSRIYSPVTANASDENGRKLVVQIVNSGQVEDLTGATLHLYWETRDKAHDGLDVFKAVDLKKGEFELSYTTDMLSNHGVLNANLVLIDTVGRVVSERFKITVTEGIDNDAIQSENSFTSLTQALIDISDLEQNYAPRLNDLTAQLQQTIKKDTGSVGSGDLSQEVKVQMTGGSVAVVGKNAVLTENIVNKQVTKEKLADEILPFEKEYNRFRIANISSTTGEYQNLNNYISSDTFIKANIGEEIVLIGNSSPNIHLKIHYFDEDFNFLNTSALYGQQATDRRFVITANGFVKLTLNYNPVITITKESFETISKSIYIYRNTLKKNTLTTSNSYYDLTLKLALEIGTLDKNSGGVPSTTNVTRLDNFLGEKRTGKYLKVVPETNINLDFTNGKSFVFEYDRNFIFLGYKELISKQNLKLKKNTNIIKIALEELTVAHIEPKLNYVTSDAQPTWVYNDHKSNRNNDNISFTYEVNSHEGRDILELDSDKKQYTTDKYFNTGVLKLPPNYDPYGKPVKLIIFNHGSGGFPEIRWGSFGLSYEQYFKYLTDEGYAMLDVYSWTSKYNVTSGESSGAPTTISALVSGYKWAIQNYNISQTGVFVSGKSSGGFAGVSLSYNRGIPVIATGLLAPVISPIREPFGAYYDTRLAYATDFGFEGDHAVLAEQEGSPAVERTHELFDYIRTNAHKLVGYNPYWSGLIGEDLTDLIESAINGTEQDYELNKGKQRFCSVPTKIWAAEDDIVNLYNQVRIYIKSIQNAQGNAEIRTMPNGTGGHNSVDSSPDAIKVQSITTRLGITHTNVPLAYVELVQFFRRFEN